MGDSVDKEINEANHRIRLLEAENKRAIKRVLETKKRIEEINKSRSRYIEDKARKHQQEEQRTKNLETVRERINSERQERQDKQFFIKYEILNMKQSVGKRGRELKEYVKRSKIQTDIEDKRRRKRLHEAVQMSKQQASVRMKLLGEFKNRNFQNHYARTVEQNDQLRSQREKNILELARKEQELLNRVNKAQDFQQSALDDLENILNS